MAVRNTWMEAGAASMSSGASRPDRPSNRYGSRVVRILLAACLIGSVARNAVLAAGVSGGSADLDFFEKQVRPVLANRCQSCHGIEKQKGGLRLDHGSFVHRGGEGGAVIDPGDPDASRLIRAIRYDDPDLQMPPKGRIPAGEIAVLQEWIRRGAPWAAEPVPAAGAEKPEFDLETRRAAHWAWRPLLRPAVPEVADPGWARHPIDAFIAERLDSVGLKPSPPAGRRALIRRLYFDLIGLPPEPEAVDDLLDSRAVDALNRVVDRLLASPHFGERWGRHWLDLVRYAESYGHEFDYTIRDAWRYRDYVVRALNQDVSYDRFMAEHIAGDLLPRPRRHLTDGYDESVIGTGFWFLGQAVHAPVDVLGDEADRIDNQIDVMSKTFLGLTVACARCHDHKFDAISTRDYYALAGFLQSSHRYYTFLDPTGSVDRALPVVNRVRDQSTAFLESALDTSCVELDARISPFLLAARESLHGTPKPTDSPAGLRPRIVFEDFESDSYEGWTVTGSAFGPGPAAGTLPNQGRTFGFQGARLVNSFLGGDASQGRMISEPFHLNRHFVRFLIGGGQFPETLVIRLLIDGRVVRSETGPKSARLRWAHWDVREFEGQEAQIEIVDAESGGWGHIDVDQIELVDQVENPLYQRPPAIVARESGLAPDRLQAWVDALRDDSLRDPGHPLHPWFLLANGADAASAQSDRFDDRRDKFVTDSKKLAADQAAVLADSTVFASFDSGDFDGWIANGEAFGDGPTRRGDWFFDGDRVRLAPAGVAHSGMRSRRLRGALRSPTFTIDSDHILYRIAGEGVTVRVVIDGFFMIEYHSLLFGGVSFDVNTGGRFVWRSQGGDLGRYRGHRAHIEVLDEGDGWVAIDEIRFSDSPARGPAPVSDLITKLSGDRIRSASDLAGAYDDWVRDARRRWHEGAATRDDAALLDWLFHHDAAGDVVVTADALDRLARSAGQAEQTLQGSDELIRVLAITDGSGENQPVLTRGNPRLPADPVPRRFLEALAGPEQPDIDVGSGRLELVRRMLAPENPLPARVMVNRVWGHLFGRGIVPTPDDFGVLGQPPTHPELLDWLADWFRTEGEWSVKRLIRLIVSSNTYQMASNQSDERAETADPSNEWLHRMRVRRLEGEAIRDGILALSGRLDRTLYGPSVPVHLTAFMEGRGRPGSSGPLDGNGRRSIYTEIRRNFLPPMMMAFDMPVPFTTIGRRTVSNVPAQALTLMNDPLVVEQARVWAARLLSDPELRDSEERARHAFQMASSRSPSDAEIAAALEFIREQTALRTDIAPDSADSEESDASADARLDAWADFCHVLLNAKDFIYLE